MTENQFKVERSSLIQVTSDIIFSTSGHYSINGKTIQGDIIFTTNGIEFSQKQSKGPKVFDLPWSQIKKVAKINRRNEKGFEITTQNDQIHSFSTVRDRENIVHLMRMITEITSQPGQSYGFSTLGEGARRINIFRAPHVIEDTFPALFHDVSEKVKDQQSTIEMLSKLGCSEIVVSPWQKSSSGLIRTIQYCIHIFRVINVTEEQTLRRQTDQASVDIIAKYCSQGEPAFAQLTLQLFFKEVEGDSPAVDAREAYSIEWIKDTSDKEFVENSMTKLSRERLFYLKSSVMGEQFDSSPFEGKWQKHQPYIIVILLLLSCILTLIFAPKKTNWYSILAGIGCLVLFFSQ